MSDAPIEKVLGDGVQSLTLTTYCNDDGQWQLEIVDADNNKTVWEDPFDSAEAALAEGENAVNEEGLSAFIGDWSQLL